MKRTSFLKMDSRLLCEEDHVADLFGACWMCSDGMTSQVSERTDKLPVAAAAAPWVAAGTVLVAVAVAVAVERKRLSIG